MTLMSVLSLTDFLLGQGVNYVLTASLNQDPLEVKQELAMLFVAKFIRHVFCFLQRFFGPVRSFGGDKDHPTVAKCSQLLFRLLSHSHQTSQETAKLARQAQMSTFESLGEKCREALQKKKSLEEEVWRRLTSIP